MLTNTSGYRGVSWHKAARKWGAYIRVDGVRRYLGLFDTAEDASAAYLREAARLRGNTEKADGDATRLTLLGRVRALYAAHGVAALATPFLEKQKDALYPKLLAAGLNQSVLLAELGLAAEYAEWKRTHRGYRGSIKLQWSWDEAVAKARELVAEHGDLPTVEWCRRNGLSGMTAAVHKSERLWEDLRIAIGLKPSRNFCQSANGMRWLSQPEALLSDFLFVRGIEHKRGERYPTDYEKTSGRKWARYDLHFRAKGGDWIDVEVWGDSLSPMSGGRYAKTRALKEAWQRDRPNFLGISYKDCLSAKRLAEILEPFIGDDSSKIEPTNAPESPLLSNFASKAEVLEACRTLAAQMPDGNFPGDSWLRKRGKHAGRPGPTYNSLSIYVNRWLGGTRAARALLDQADASTTKWTPESVETAWNNFIAKTGLTPSQCLGNTRAASLSREIKMEARKIYGTAQRLGLLDTIRKGKFARRVIWTPDHARSEWRAFVQEHGRTPSECMSGYRRKTLPRAITDKATRIYDAARWLGILAELRQAVR